MGSYNEQKSWLKTYPEWAALFDMGTAESDRVVVVMQNIPQAVIACLAIWMRNAVVVPLNPMYTADELTYYLDDCGTRLLICQDDLYEDRISKAAADRPDMIVITTSPLDLLGNPSTQPEQFLHATKRFFTDTHDFISLVNSCSNRDTLIVYPSADALAYLVYTSGTTGPAKGAMIRHDNVVHNAIVYREACRLNRDDAVLGVAPLFHITGIVAHQAIAFHLGIPMVLFARFDVREALRLIEKYRVTFTVAAITVYIAMLNFRQIQNFDLSSFKKAYSGGAPVSPATVKKFIDSMGLAIYNVYGLTESCSPATITPLGMEGPVDEDSGALSVGLIIPGHEAWIVDIDNPNIEMPAGAEGELVLRGPGIIDGYWEKPDETANAIKDGRFFTGDVAKFDEHGWCFIVDRKKDLINVSGYKVWPRDVEDVLYRHPAVSEAAVVGVPDEYRGETVKAFVSIGEDYQGRVTPEELIAFCKERMAAFKYPRIVRIIDEIPKTATGKFLRRQLRKS
jgi:long-chain acyl-CoA synthetase